MSWESEGWISRVPWPPPAWSLIHSTSSLHALLGCSFHTCFSGSPNCCPEGEKTQFQEQPRTGTMFLPGNPLVGQQLWWAGVRMTIGGDSRDPCSAPVCISLGLELTTHIGSTLLGSRWSPPRRLLRT